MSWHKITLDEVQVASGGIDIIKNYFETLFLDSLAPKEMALFADKALLDSTEKEIEVSLYISPGSLTYASELISTYSGTVCEKPTADTLELLVGQSEAWDLLK
jgi:hypothetical protein